MISSLLRSWKDTTGNVNSTEELTKWISELNKNARVNVNECSINKSTFWFYDDYNGEVLNRRRSFFSIKGIRRFEDERFISEQPVIVQPEIGYLGIICREIDGVLNFLMQAKIEPGNVNCVQISPTIQATKSNFTRVHGGNLPAYFEFFENSSKYKVLFDQIQSEQAARFYKKRNRNMIMLVDEDFEILPNFKWMTLGQIKKLMEIDNLVNMDTRTVLSGIPLVTNTISSAGENLREYFIDEAFHNSVFCADLAGQLPSIYQKINNYKMFKDIKTVLVPLNQLVDWDIDEYGIVCRKNADFMVRYYDIEITGREVQHWTQPLFKALGTATFGLLTRVHDNKRQFLVRLKSEIGSFDKIELGPSVQWEASHCLYEDDDVGKVFRKMLKEKRGVITDVVLSEEGGRFYREQNGNVIIDIDENDFKQLPDDYIWCDYGTLNYLVQVNNCLNIQLRNLLSLLKI